MTDETPKKPVFSAEDPWETWSKVALGLTILMAGMWTVVFLRLGITSVKVLAWIPYLGASTLVILAWGLVRTLFNPPVLRRSRTIAFFGLLAAGFVGTEPLVPAPLATEGYVTPLTYQLPVRGEWTTLAGGPDRDRNYHATFPPARWGYDFTKVDGDGKKFRLDGKKNTDWLCFGEPVFAPVDGKIVRLQNQHVDNHPGEISPQSMVGNHIVIEAGPAEFAMLSHLKKSSITVKLGDLVRRGDVLAACGNSGQSPEPHVHMHVQDRVEFPIAQGLPIPFTSYLANDKLVEVGMPRGSTMWDVVDGDMVANAH